MWYPMYLYDKIKKITGRYMQPVIIYKKAKGKHYFKKSIVVCPVPHGFVLPAKRQPCGVQYFADCFFQNDK